MGWNGSGGGETRKTAEERRGSRSPARGLAAGLAAVAAGCLAVWVFFGGDAPVERAKDVERKRPAKTVETRPKKPVRPTAGAKPERLPMPTLTGERIEAREAIPAPQPLDEMKAEAAKQAKKAKHPFTNGIEQLIALATPPFPGATVPPLPPITDESVARSLKAALSRVIMPDENDSESVLRKKLVVASAKMEFEELREKEGLGFTEYVNALRKQANEDAAFMAEANRLADELYHDAGVSDADYVHYREELNKLLRERGLPEIEKEEGETQGKPREEQK